MSEYFGFKKINNMLITGVWIINKAVGVGWCDAPECKVPPAVYCLGLYTCLH